MDDKERTNVMIGLSTCRVKLNRFCMKFVSRKAVDQDAIMAVRELASQSRGTFREFPIKKSIIKIGSLESRLSKYIVKKTIRSDSVNVTIKIGSTEMMVKVIEFKRSEIVIPWWFRNQESKGKKFSFNRKMNEAINSWLRCSKNEL